MKNLFKKKKVLFFSILILVGFFTASFALAAGIPFFGGKIVSITNCTCSEGSAVTIVGYPSIFSGTYLYLPGSTMARGKGSVMSGKFIVGQYTPGGSCLLIGEPCIPSPISKGTMKLISTN
ncbi:MAG: hypothetical protein WCX46_01195 [Candidatus Paceibacterota bacterium]|jgi:hypothetical protein